MLKIATPCSSFSSRLVFWEKYQFLKVPNGFLIWHGTFQLQEKWPHKTKCKWYWIRHLGTRVKWFLTSYCPLSTPKLAHPKYPFSTWEYTQSALFSHLPFSLFNTQLFVFFMEMIGSTSWLQIQICLKNVPFFLFRTFFSKAMSLIAGPGSIESYHYRIRLAKWP